MRTAVLLSLLATASLATAMLAVPGSSLAAGGLSCNAGDKGVTLSLDGGVSRGMGAMLFNFNGEVGISDQSVAEDLRRTRFELDHVAQYWLDGEEMRLGLYRERDPEKEHGYVQVSVMTERVGDPDEGMYNGVFVVSVWDGAGDGEPRQASFEGKVECFVE